MERCGICMEELTEQKPLLCTHAFHEECLRQWFQISSTCPMCRRECNVEELGSSGHADTRPPQLTRYLSYSLIFISGFMLSRMHALEVLGGIILLILLLVIGCVPMGLYLMTRTLYTTGGPLRHAMPL